MTAADLATVADIERVLARQDAIDAKLDRVLAALPENWISLAATKQQTGLDPRTIVSAIERGDLVGRHVGRRWLVLASSLKPKSAAEIAALARASR